jgi:hypothetical protein
VIPVFRVPSAEKSQILSAMPAKSRFTRLDAFTKTVEDARIRTTSGGIVTITSLLIIFWLAWGEWSDYRRVIVRPELVVDKSRGRFLSFSSRNANRARRQYVFCVKGHWI